MKEGADSPPSGFPLNKLVEYELRGAARYRRFTTLVMIGVAAPRCDVASLLADCLRGSDEFFRIDGTAAILMGETDSAGALAAVSRYKSVVKDQLDLRFGLASYPTDAQDTPSMIATARRRLLEAKAGKEPGAVVFRG